MTAGTRRLTRRGVLAIATAVFSFTTPGGNADAHSLHYLFSIGSPGTGSQLKTPRVICFVDPHDELYVLSGDAHIHIFTSEGAFLYRYGKNEGIVSPQGLVVGSRGWTYISRGMRGDILVCNYRGVVDHRHALEGASDPVRPWQLVIDREDNLYVVGQSSKNILVFNPQEELVRTMRDDERFSAISDLAIDRENNLYVVNGVTSRIHVFDGDGIHLLSFGERGSGVSKLSAAVAIVVSEEMGILVLDTNRQKILFFTPEGEFVSEAGGLGRGEGQFFYPSDLVLGNDNMLYVCDTMNDRIQVFRMAVE